MPASPDLDFQAVAFAAITAVVSGVPVLAHPAPGQVTPYIQIGHTESEGGPAGNTYDVSIHTWSGAEGPHEIKDLQYKIQVALELASYASADWSFVINVMQYQTCFVDVDGENWHGVQRFKVLASLIS